MVISILPKKETSSDTHRIKTGFWLWSGLRDSNPRSLGPKPSAIPNFAKPGSPFIILERLWKSKVENALPMGGFLV